MRRRALISWARLLARIDENRPLSCPRCQGEMRLMAFLIDPDPIRVLHAHSVSPRLRHRLPRAPALRPHSKLRGSTPPGLSSISLHPGIQPRHRRTPAKLRPDPELNPHPRPCAIPTALVPAPCATTAATAKCRRRCAPTRPPPHSSAAPDTGDHPRSPASPATGHDRRRRGPSARRHSPPRYEKGRLDFLSLGHRRRHHRGRVESQPICILGLVVHVLTAGASFNLHSRVASARVLKAARE